MGNISVMAFERIYNQAPEIIARVDRTKSGNARYIGVNPYPNRKSAKVGPKQRLLAWDAARRLCAPQLSRSEALAVTRKYWAELELEPENPGKTRTPRKRATASSASASAPTPASSVASPADSSSASSSASFSLGSSPSSSRSPADAPRQTPAPALTDADAIRVARLLGLEP